MSIRAGRSATQADVEGTGTARMSIRGQRVAADRLSRDAGRQMSFNFETCAPRSYIMRACLHIAIETSAVTENQNPEQKAGDSIDERKQIRMQIKSRLSEADHLDQAITTSLQQAEVLRQSILKKAFSGRLAPLDRREEPASALPARDKAEKAKCLQAPGKRSRGSAAISEAGGMQL